MTSQFETSELIDVIEVSYRLVQVQQQKYVCRCRLRRNRSRSRTCSSGQPLLARFAIKVATDKYTDHIPLARQSRILRRHGVDVTTQTLWGLLEVLERLRAATPRCSGHARQPVIGLDQTSWKRLDDKTKSPGRCGA